VDAGRTGMSATRDQALPVSSPEDGQDTRSTIGKTGKMPVLRLGRRARCPFYDWEDGQDTRSTIGVFNRSKLGLIITQDSSSITTYYSGSLIPHSLIA
jgi:hypothetical protein